MRFHCRVVTECCRTLTLLLRQTPHPAPPVVWDGNLADLLNGIVTFFFLLLAPFVALGWRFMGGSAKIQKIFPGCHTSPANMHTSAQ
jgi:uncharacterized membrane-anchored protein YitT (DUF2179 family)